MQKSFSWLKLDILLIISFILFVFTLPNNRFPSENAHGYTFPFHFIYKELVPHIHFLVIPFRYFSTGNYTFTLFTLLLQYSTSSSNKFIKFSNGKITSLLSLALTNAFVEFIFKFEILFFSQNSIISYISL